MVRFDRGCFVLVFVAWPLVDVGLLMRPLLGMVFLVLADRPVRPRRPRSICPGGTQSSRRHRLRIADDDARIALGYGRHPERGSGTIVLAGALRSALEPRPGAGTRHAEPHHRCGSWCIFYSDSIRVPVRPDRAVFVRRLCHGAGANCLKLDRLALLISMITLSSLGLSDITPVHAFARSLVMLEALLGQLFTTVLIARTCLVGGRGPDQKCAPGNATR